MRYHTYVLKSSINNDFYVGSTADLHKRIRAHNEGRVRSTKAYRPWKILGHKEFGSRSEAMLYEKFLKTHQQKEILKEKYN